jgi:hypothetical protein
LHFVCAYLKMERSAPFHGSVVLAYASSGLRYGHSLVNTTDVKLLVLHGSPGNLLAEKQQFVWCDARSDACNPSGAVSVVAAEGVRPKRVAGNAKIKERIRKAEAVGDVKRLAELRSKRSGCTKVQKKKKAKERAKQAKLVFGPNDPEI